MPRCETPSLPLRERELPEGLRGRSAHTQCGLTLVELLIVLLIVSMTAGIVMFAVPRQPNDLLSVSQQFERDVIAARDQAVAEAALYGIEPMPGGYVVYRLVPEGWLAVEQRSLPRGLAFAIEGGDMFDMPEHRDEIGFGLPPKEEEATASLMPDILFAADGTATPFTATFGTGRLQSRVMVGPFGELKEDTR
ncbi:prepilin-type N-terminal cleavage/methylation domain-containing protein [Parvularcula maris]|uniref:Prepilin-type N-terminal cleavage/methylation domain-containing protein n=1 Tax=Parvularcula maris TaxID=2965077 RepID=A0A9X2RJT2_9PROT|nr:prepilin-type N-terminal cleavage/methylation domain-containing protein [Parvularcula maris]